MNHGVVNDRFARLCRPTSQLVLWDNAARASGVKINKTPKKNAVTQTDKSGSGLGHVAWVKSVSKDGKKVTVEEYNYRKDKYGVRTVDKGKFQNYIHL
jgi:surface antigen